MKGLLIEETSWEDLSKLQKIYSNLYLKDEVSFQPGRNDTIASTDTESPTEDNLPRQDNKEHSNEVALVELNLNSSG